MVTTLRAVQANFDLSEEKPKKMNNSKNEAVVAPIIVSSTSPNSYLGVLANGAASWSGSDVVGEVGGHQYWVSGWKGTGLTVAHAGVDQMGAFTCAATVTADGHVEGWRRGKSTGLQIHAGI